MNLLQSFLSTCNAQSRDVIQETAVFEGRTIYGTFGDAQTMPVMTANGYQDHLVLTFKATADQFADTPAARQNLTRSLNGRVYFVQMIDYTNPVVFTFILTDREV